jgi:hypothetical protein
MRIIKSIQFPKIISDHKTEQWVADICNETDFVQICDNAESIYEQLNINNNNCLDIKDAYSEIFKLIDFA